MTGKMRPEGTILVVEDSRTQAEFLGHILKKEGCPYVVAENGRIALDLVKQERPSIILTDILMPEMDGFELCRRIRQDPALADIPVILVTQLFDPADILKGLEAGADNFIIKPFEPESVFSQIHEVFIRKNIVDPDRSLPPLEVEFFKTRYTIHADRMRVLHILITTYDIAIKKNLELQDAQERLFTLNEQLQQMVGELQVTNENLLVENNRREQAERGLAQANKKLQLMTSITRHDLLNQLTVLQGYLELSQMLSKSDPVKTQEYVRQSLAVVTKTISTVKFTGDYQNIGVTSPAWHPVDTLITNALKYATLGPVRIENTIPAGAEIFADPLIEKVIFNLIDNALRYGMRLNVIRFGFERREQYAVLTCEDDGVGIPEENKERIFSFGYGTNTGMGLFLVREILAITGITIREIGKPGKGARFEILIPAGSFRGL